MTTDSNDYASPATPLQRKLFTFLEQYTDIENNYYENSTETSNATDARTEIFEYIEGYYNTHRKHSALGYKTPSQFEAQIHSAN